HVRSGIVLDCALFQGYPGVPRAARRERVYAGKQGCIYAGRRQLHVLSSRPAALLAVVAPRLSPVGLMGRTTTLAAGLLIIVRRKGSLSPRNKTRSGRYRISRKRCARRWSPCRIASQPWRRPKGPPRLVHNLTRRSTSEPTAFHFKGLTLTPGGSRVG